MSCNDLHDYLASAHQECSGIVAPNVRGQADGKTTEISDRIGRKKMYLIGAVVIGLFGFLYFGMVDTAIPSAVFIAIVLSLIPHNMLYGPQAALIAEAFTPRLRYSGASLGYQLASVIAGGPAPLIATALFAAFHSGYAISIYIAFCAVVSLASAAFMPDYTGRDISSEYDDRPQGTAYPRVS
jgi:MFS family permease